MNDFDKDFEFYLACTQGDISKVKQLIKIGVKLNRRDSSGRTLLHDASVRNNTDIIRVLVQSGANEYVKDLRGRTPLMYASAKGHFEIVKYLIERNTFRIPVITDNGIAMVETHEYLDTIDDDGRSCLMYACGEGHSSCVQLILDSGADVNILDTGGRNALMYACREGFTDLVQLLIDHGISVNAVSNVGWSALHYSCLRGHYRLVKLLLENNIDPNIENNMSNTAAYFAFKSGNVEIVKLLLEFGLQVSSKDVADILWLIKFWTAFVQASHFTKYEQFISCVCELLKFKSVIDESSDLPMCVIETVYRTYMRQKYELISDKTLRNVIKYLLKLSVHAGHVDKARLRSKANWFSAYFCLDKYSIIPTASEKENEQDQRRQITKILTGDDANFKYFQSYDNSDENAFIIYKDFRQMLISLVYKPASLMSLCRKTIRHEMPVFNRKTINELPIPLKLHQYLHFDYL